MIMMDLFYLENMSILLDLKIMLKTGAVIAWQLLESQQRHNAIGSGANRTKLEGGGIPTSGIVVDQSTSAHPLSSHRHQAQSARFPLPESKG
jgi:hypothetical protein